MRCYARARINVLMQASSVTGMIRGEAKEREREQKKSTQREEETIKQAT